MRVDKYNLYILEERFKRNVVEDFGKFGSLVLLTFVKVIYRWEKVVVLLVDQFIIFSDKELENEVFFLKGGYFIIS